MLGDCTRLTQLIAADPGAAHAVSPEGLPVVAPAAFFGRVEALGLLLGADPDVPAANPLRAAGSQG